MWLTSVHREASQNKPKMIIIMMMIDDDPASDHD